MRTWSETDSCSTMQWSYQLQDPISKAIADDEYYHDLYEICFHISILHQVTASSWFFHFECYSTTIAKSVFLHFLSLIKVVT